MLDCAGFSVSSASARARHGSPPRDGLPRGIALGGALGRVARLLSGLGLDKAVGFGRRHAVPDVRTYWGSRAEASLWEAMRQAARSRPPIPP